LVGHSWGTEYAANIGGLRVCPQKVLKFSFYKMASVTISATKNSQKKLINTRQLYNLQEAKLKTPRTTRR